MTTEFEVIDWIESLEYHEPTDEAVDRAFEIIFGRKPDDRDGDSQARFDLICSTVL